MIPVMKALRALLAGAAMLVCPCPLAAEPPAPGLEQRLTGCWDSAEGLGLGWEISIGEARLVARAAGPPDAPQVRLGFGMPALRLGHLSPTGLLRELADPLALSPGSDVLGERSGLVLGSALDGPEAASMSLEAVPDAMTLLGRALAGGVLQGGLVVRALDGPRCVLEGLAAVSFAPADKEDAWILSSQRWPGGKILHVALRAALRAPDGLHGSSAFLTLGASSGEHSPPGAFLIAAASAGGSPVALDLLLALATPRYVSPEGRPPATAGKAGARLRAGGSIGSIEVSYVTSAARLPPSPSVFLPTSEAASVSLEGTWKLVDRIELSARLAARGRRECSADGPEKLETAGSLGVDLETARLSFGAEAGLTESDGASLDLDCSMGTVHLAAGISGLGRDPAGRLEVKLRCHRLELTVGAGDLPILGPRQPGASRPLASFHVGVAWSSSACR